MEAESQPYDDTVVLDEHGAVMPGSATSQTGLNHPLAGVIGMFADDPLWDEFIEEMAKYRRECDERYAAELDKEQST